MQIGKVLRRICPKLDVNRPFEHYFHIQYPEVTLNFDAIRAHSQSLFILEVCCSSILLKGQMVHSAEQDVLLFLGSPWISDLNALNSSGLMLTDFAIHDHKTDYLVLLQAQETALSDARKLADELKQQRAEVHKALEREKELNDLKSRFITTASHEFRTPLGIIASSTGILQDYADRINEAIRQKHLNRIQAAVSRMTGLLEDVLTMNQVEMGTLKSHPRPLKLAKFCQEIVDTCQGKTLHSLTYTASRALLNRVVLLDRNLLDQLLTNLLSNAVKYTPEPGNIVIDVREQDGQIVIVVQDSGIGIPPEELPYICDPFHRASNVGNAPGTGLGLSIAQHCAELHNGNLSIASEVGAGTTVTVTLPLQYDDNLTEPNVEIVVC